MPKQMQKMRKEGLVVHPRPGKSILSEGTRVTCDVETKTHWKGVCDNNPLKKFFTAYIHLHKIFRTPMVRETIKLLLSMPNGIQLQRKKTDRVTLLDEQDKK